MRQPSVRVAAGTTEAANAHIVTLIRRIRLVNRQLKEAHQRLDILTARLMETEDNTPGQQKQHDVEILASLPGVGRIVLATLLAEAFDALRRRDYAARLAQFDRCRPRHQAVGQELDRHKRTSLA
ncbi:transposase [Mesorhizobium sp. A556]